MTNLLIRLFVKDGERYHSPVVRGHYGRLAGWVGIASNIILFLIKLVTGFVTGNIAITADSVNNLSDSASSVITLVAFRLSGLPSDQEHPYGHARFEYIGGMAVSAVIIAIGVQCFFTSFQKTLHPEPVSFSLLVGVLLLLSIGIKWWQGRFYRLVGQRIDSGALIATAADSRNDVITTSAVLLSAVIAHYTGWNLDGPMGLGVAVFVVWSGIGLLRDTINPLLGMAPDIKQVEAIGQRIRRYPSVIGLHDLMIHSYGPGRVFASAHVELPASQDIMKSHDIIDGMEKDFLTELGIHMVIHLDPVVTDDPRLDAVCSKLREIAAGIDPELSVHDIRMVERESRVNLIFDVGAPPRFDMTDRMLRERLQEEIHSLYPHYDTVITIDRNFTSTTG